MKTKLSGIALGAALALAAPASAAEVVLGMTGNSGVSGADGNGRFFSGSNGGTTVNVRASGWSIEGTTVRDSFLGAFGTGLGVTSGDDAGGAGNRHVTDNQTRRDFILLQFDQAVQLVSGKFTTYELGGQRDSDATIGFGTTAFDWRSQPALNNASVGTLGAMFSGGFTSLGTAGGGTRNLGTGTSTGNLWLVGADFVNLDRRTDGFKFSALTVNSVESAVPEPATWAMMLIGFGAVGYSMRLRPSGRLAMA